MAGHSRLKDGVASARLCPAIHVFSGQAKQDVDARQPGYAKAMPGFGASPPKPQRRRAQGRA